MRLMDEPLIARFVGGYDDGTELPKRGDMTGLILDERGFHFWFGRGRRRQFEVAWENLQSIEFLGPGEVAQSRLGPVLLFGVLGLGASGRQKLTELLLHTKHGPVFFQVLDRTPFELRARLRSSLEEHSIPEGGLPIPDRAVGSIPPLIADELSKLADLREQGVVTEEEFSAQKARLLGK